MIVRMLAVTVMLALCGATPAGHERAPRMPIESIRQLRFPLPAPYDANADANAAVDAAMARARARGKPLLIDLGANWCADCRVLAGVLEVAELKAFVARNFELVQVDIGKFDHNLDIPARFGVNRLEAVPAILLIDSRTGKLRNRSDMIALGDARIMTPQQIADRLAGWAS